MTNAPFTGAEDGLLPTGAVDTADQSIDNVVQFPGVSDGDFEDTEGEGIIDYSVAYGDRVFTIEEPDSGTIVRLLQFATNIATRAERYKAANFAQTLQNAERARAANAQNTVQLVKLLKSGELDAQQDGDLINQMQQMANGDFGSLRAELISFVSVATQSMNDLITLLSITFFGASREKEGVTYFTNLYQQDPKALKISPLITALWYRFELSEDLRDALKNFQRVQGRMRKAFPATSRTSPSTARR